MPVCQVCQHDNPAGAEFCEDCGAALKSPVGASAPTPSGGGTASGASSSAGQSPGGTPSGATGGSGSAGAPSASASSPDALGEAGASVGTTLSGAGDVGVASDDVEAASPNANAAPAGAPSAGGATGSAATGTAGAPASGAAAGAATSQAGGAAPAGAGTSPSGTSTAGAGPATPSTGAASGAQQARLVAIRYGAPTGREIPLLGQRLVVGRFDPETGPVDVDLSETGEAVHVSRQHAELFREPDGRWSVRDLGSTNGVFVKGSADSSFGPRITAPRPLDNGDEVTFGNARFVFRTD